MREVILKVMEHGAVCSFQLEDWAIKGFDNVLFVWVDQWVIVHFEDVAKDVWLEQSADFDAFLD